MIDDAFFVFQRRLGLQEKSSRLRSTTSPFGSRLLYAATVVVLASLLTPVACLVLGFARYEALRRLDEASQYTRPSDGGVSYERLDSVSSVVDIRQQQQQQQQLYQHGAADVEEMTVI